LSVGFSRFPISTDSLKSEWEKRLWSIEMSF
jgi:hypothetical protein